MTSPLNLLAAATRLALPARLSGALDAAPAPVPPAGIELKKTTNLRGGGICGWSPEARTPTGKVIPTLNYRVKCSATLPSGSEGGVTSETYFSPTDSYRRSVPILPGERSNSFASRRASEPGTRVCRSRRQAPAVLVAFSSADSCRVTQIRMTGLQR